MINDPVKSFLTTNFYRAYELLEGFDAVMLCRYMVHTKSWYLNARIFFDKEKLSGFKCNFHAYMHIFFVVIFINLPRVQQIKYENSIK